jgi:hypothetical protein
LIGINAMSGTVIGAPLITATRRSVIFSCEGMELRWTFLTAPSTSSAVSQPVAPTPAAAMPKDLKKDLLSHCGHQ